MSDVTLLKDISAKITKGTTPSTVGNEFKNQGITFFKAQSIDDEGRVVNGNLAHIDDETDEKLKRSRIVQDDLLITIAGTIGRVHRVNDKYTPANCNQAVAIVRLNQPADSKYVYYALRSPKVQGGFLGRVVHAVQANLSLTEIGLTEIYFPEIERREAIAEVLSSIDDKIDLLNRQNETLEAMAQTLFRQWFIEEADDSWEQVELIDCCSKISSGGTPKTSVVKYYEGNVPWYSTKELKDGYLFESEKTISEEAIIHSSAKLFPENTVVIAIYAAPTVGRLGILTKPSAFNQAACGLVANPNVCCPEFLYLQLLNDRGILNSLASGTAQQNLNVGKIKSYKINLPPKEVMNNFKSSVGQLFDKIRLNSFNIKSMITLRDTLLPKLMSGEVRVKLD